MNRHLRHRARCHAERIAHDQLIVAGVGWAKNSCDQVCAVCGTEQRTIIKQNAVFAPPVGKGSLPGDGEAAKGPRQRNASELNLQLSGYRSEEHTSELQ